jgi:reactive chlorine resistance protein C
VATAGRLWVRYGLVVVIAWIAALKYTSYEAAGIQPLIAHSPLFSWLYSILSVRAFAAVLGSLELTAALLIAIRPLAPRLSAAGSAMAVLLFASTLSFLFTTPGATAAGGFPVLSVLPGQFLLKGHPR